LILAGDSETCDDGNNVAGDGCDEACQIEDGWSCDLVSTELPDELVLPVVYRDFIHKVSDVGSLPKHPDFQAFSGSNATPDLVGPILGSSGKPTYTGICEAGQVLDAALCPYNEQTTSQEDFDQWYVDTEGVNLSIADALTFTRQADDTYVFGGTGSMFPLDDLGWMATTATDPPSTTLPEQNHSGFAIESSPARPERLRDEPMTIMSYSPWNIVASIKGYQLVTPPLRVA
jgi:cysteine-rich repeat protein